MMELIDLSLLRNSLIQQYQERFSGQELVLPENFKKEVNKIYSDEIFYYKYTACVKTRAGLNIYLPNQWFYIASNFTDFYNALLSYKKIALDLFSSERINRLNDNELDQSEKDKLSASTYNSQEQEYIKKFVTDYNWWGGGKTIERGDFFVSPILNMANVVNASQTYITTLCQFLAENSRLSLLLNHQAIEQVQNRDKMRLRYASVLRRSFITAIHSKPFILLAGISGTGKSRIVRELARSCDKIDDDPWSVQSPVNYCMIPVKPNWHDSTDLIGYASGISGKTEYVVTDFLRFLTLAWFYQDVPFFLCLDEMNLAPVEQYFAEFLSVIESRKLRDGKIVTDPILCLTSWDKTGDKVSIQILEDLFNNIYVNTATEASEALPRIDKLKEQFLNSGISIPQNLIVMGTVNMDETTFTFSRKVLDRAMTIEMNEVDLRGGLQEDLETFEVDASQLIADAVEGKDIYSENKDECDTILLYLETVNEALRGTPFGIAYRTRNEFLLYVIENLKYKGNHSKEFCMARALDEITSMKILSRIEGDDTRLRMPDGGTLLKHLQKVISGALQTVLAGYVPNAETGESLMVCHGKLEEMDGKLLNGYCTFWT